SPDCVLAPASLACLTVSNPLRHSVVRSAGLAKGREERRRQLQKLIWPRAMEVSGTGTEWLMPQDMEENAQLVI
ncbi:unnamed protein product, partial [Closterium sp. Naga37s-1]